MAAPMEEQETSKKSRRKLLKKILRSQQTVLKRDGIETNNLCTKILCVINGGLDVGVSHDEISTIFSSHGDMEDIVMLPRKPYCFVCFAREHDAEVAMEKLNGTELPPTDHRGNPVTLYITYVSKVPQSLSPSNEFPPGLILIPDFVTEDYAGRLLSAIIWEDSANSAEQRSLKHRQVRHYGYEFKYGINDVDINDPLPNGIPPVCNDLLSDVKLKGIVNYIPDQLTVNKYEPGQGIPPHVDTPAAFEDGIMSLSLGSQVLMDFRHPDGRHLTVLLPPRSLMIMTGESRYLWSHGITPRKSDIVRMESGNLNVVKRDVRISFTFRKIIPPQERLSRILPTFNDKTSESDRDLDQEVTDLEKLEKEHVHQVYEEIADHFSGTRHTPWPRIVDFLNSQPPGALMADIGCGNGKYLGVNPSMYQIGSDRSSNLATICRDRQFQVFVGDVMTIPLKTSSMDVSICIAVIHHLSNQERRLKAIEELVRILRPGGKCLIYVWAMEQEVNKVKSKYLKEKKFEKSDSGSISSTVDCTINKNSVNVSMDGNIVKSDCMGDTDCSLISANGSETWTENDPKCNGDSEINVVRKGPSYSGGIDSSLSDTSTCKEDDCSKEMSCIKLAVHKNRTEFRQQDLLVPWERKSKSDSDKNNTSKCVFHRYYHVFMKGELEALCGKVRGCKVIGGYYDQGNWAVILEKL
ncbi:hypothetical protein FSP39_009216 [Pinctada imbricata]|uniref:tRNA (carboxymethyluridine(34)-5-O)-methyltransferase n=1 Tax=Pinctada imbricata TaxID=66713 RepID=A0AA88Y6X2_PINIB|nr:hypothetical protein FSP39_009216 [Pinctada imbricata]